MTTRTKAFLIAALIALVLVVASALGYGYNDRPEPDATISRPPTTSAPETSTTAPTTTEPPIEIAEVAPPTTVYDWGEVLCDRVGHPAHHEPCVEVPANSVANPGPIGAVADDIWWQLALCESSGRNLGADSGGGPGYFGWLGWNAIGEEGYASDYSYEYQLAVTQRIAARYGFGGWPECSRRLGLI